MTKAIILAFALTIAMANMIQTSFAASSETTTMPSEHMKSKPIKKSVHHGHVHHSNLKMHKVGKAV